MQINPNITQDWREDWYSVMQARAEKAHQRLFVKSAITSRVENVIAVDFKNRKLTHA